MKLKQGLILRKVANEYIVIPTGPRTKEVQNMVYLSSSAAYLWEGMKDTEFTKEDLVQGILSHYTGVTEPEATQDIDAFLTVLKRNHFLEPEEGDTPPAGGFVRTMVKP